MGVIEADTLFNMGQRDACMLQLRVMRACM